MTTGRSGNDRRLSDTERRHSPRAPNQRTDHGGGQNKSTRGNVTSGPNGCPREQKSRTIRRKPSGHAIRRPHSSHRSSRDSTIVGKRDREAVATHTTQDSPTARRRAECSSLIGELSEDGRVVVMGAAMTARQNSRARRPLARHPLARHRARAIQTRIRSSAGPAARHGAEMEHLKANCGVFLRRNST